MKYGTRLITLAPAPMTNRTLAISVTRFAPGALIRTAKFLASPSWADLAWSTIASAPGTLSAVCAPGADAIVDQARSAQLGLAKNFAVLINAPGGVQDRNASGDTPSTSAL